MRVTFSPYFGSVKNNNTFVTKQDLNVKNNSEVENKDKFSSDSEERTNAKLKRVLSECFTVAAATGLIYFGVKRSFSVEAAKKQAAKVERLRRMPKPEYNLPKI